MTRDQIRTLVIEATETALLPAGVDVEVTEETPIFGAGSGLDSLDQVNILMAIEDAFEDKGSYIELGVEPEEKANYATVGTIIDYLAGLEAVL